LHSGQVFSLYVLGYSIGRLGIESIRIDSAHTIGGLRLNIWVSILVAMFALMTLLRQTKKAN
jgi:prolipoprotein diacylglyceryltransferase